MSFILAMPAATFRAALLAGTPWLDVFWDNPSDRPAHRRLPPAGLGRHARTRAAVLVVSGIGANAEAAWAVRTPQRIRSGGLSLSSRDAGAVCGHALGEVILVYELRRAGACLGQLLAESAHIHRR
jgi:hypothetical protein